MASFNMIIPELPSYISNMGGEDYKGLIISLFAFTALVSRPFSGRLADKIGRLPVMYFGAFASCVCSFLYPFFGSLFAFFALRLFHGLSTGFLPTGNTALLADIVPDRRRGEALGILGMSGSIGMAGGPALGSHIALHLGTDMMFYASSITAILSIIVIGGMTETLKEKEKFRLSLLRLKKTDLIEPRVFLPTAVMICTSYSFGLMLTIVPDISEHLNLANKGLYFSIMLFASIITRVFSGKASDRFGREKVLLVGTILLVIGTFLTGATNNVAIFMTGGVFFGISTGITSPTIFAWTVDLASGENRGRAIATMYMGLELGIILGSLLSAFLYNNSTSNFLITFASGSVLGIIAAIVIALRIHHKLKIN